jgi:hypothetical protein
MNWIFISQKTAFFLTTAVKDYNLTLMSIQQKNTSSFIAQNEQKTLWPSVGN